MPEVDATRDNVERWIESWKGGWSRVLNLDPVPLMNALLDRAERADATQKDKPIHGMFSEEDGGITGYMCKTDFDFELGMAADGNRVFPSVTALRESRSCVDQCGIVEVKVFCTRVVQEENYWGDEDE